MMYDQALKTGQEVLRIGKELQIDRKCPGYVETTARLDAKEKKLSQNEFLQFFYGDRNKLTMENITAVISLVADCLEICERFLIESLNSNNVCFIYDIAIRFDLFLLIDACKSHIQSNTSSVFGSKGFLECSKLVLSQILELDGLSCAEIQLFQACMDWIQNKCDCDESHEALSSEFLPKMNLCSERLSKPPITASIMSTKRSTNVSFGPQQNVTNGSSFGSNPNDSGLSKLSETKEFGSVSQPNEPQPSTSSSFAAPAATPPTSTAASLTSIASPMSKLTVDAVDQKSADTIKAAAEEPETLFATLTTANTSAGSVREADEDLIFNPVIELLPALVEVKTGEENETVLFEHRANLMRYIEESKEWKERGIGNMKIMAQKNDPNKVQLLMQREQELKICCNQMLTKDMKFNKMPNTKTALTWFGQEYSENELQVKKLAIRFKTAEICEQFHDAILAAQAKMGNDTGKPTEPLTTTIKSAASTETTAIETGANETGNATNNDDNADKSNENAAPDYVNYDPHYDPIIASPVEENETKLFGERAKLYSHDFESKQWKERGVGEFKILYHPANDSFRLLLQCEQIHELVLNMALTSDIKISPMKQSDTAFIWVGPNYAKNVSGDGETEKLLVRFENADLANKFNDVVQKCISDLEALE